MDRSGFFSSVRWSLFNGALSQSQVDGLGALLDALEGAALGLAESAYILATAYHETARTMLPIK